MVHRLICLLGVHCEDDAAAVGGQRWRVQVSQVSCAYSTKKYCLLLVAIKLILTGSSTFESSDFFPFEVKFNC